MTKTNSKEYTYSIGNHSWQVNVQKLAYSNGRPALVLTEVGTGEDIATATVNLANQPMEPGYAAIKNYSENEGMLEWLIANEIVEEPDPNGWVPTGWVVVPVCKILIE